MAEKTKILTEAGKSASECLKINEKNVKAKYRRGVAKARLAEMEKKNAKAQELFNEAKKDLKEVLEDDPKNKDARAELQVVLDQLKALKREERDQDKAEFAFGSAMKVLGPKAKDILGDG